MIEADVMTYESSFTEKGGNSKYPFTSRLKIIMLRFNIFSQIPIFAEAKSPLSLLKCLRFKSHC